jgi:hypothetical protein
MLKNLRRYAIITALFSIWIIFTLVEAYSYDNNFFVLTDSHPSKSFDKPQQLLKDKKIIGEFKAEKNYLGIIELKIKSVPNVKFNDEDQLVFKIKEKDSKKWLFTNNYRSGLFEGMQVFPFGFSPIENSKNKTYHFELTSISGTKDNAILLEGGDKYPIVTKYQIPKNLLLKNKALLFNFMVDKIGNIISNVDLMTSSLIFLLPLIFYILWFNFVSSKKNKKIKKNKNITNKNITNKINGKRKKYIPVICLLIFILLNTLFVPIIFSLNYIFIILFIFILIITNKLESITTFLFSLIFFAISILFIIIGNPEVAAKSAQWLYLFIIIYMSQKIKELKEKRIYEDEATS